MDGSGLNTNIQTLILFCQRTTLELEKQVNISINQLIENTVEVAEKTFVKDKVDKLELSVIDKQLL